MFRGTRTIRILAKERGKTSSASTRKAERPSVQLADEHAPRAPPQPRGARESAVTHTRALPALADRQQSEIGCSRRASRARARRRSSRLRWTRVDDRGRSAAVQETARTAVVAGFLTGARLLSGGEGFEPPSDSEAQSDFRDRRIRSLETGRNGLSTRASWLWYSQISSLAAADSISHPGGRRFESA